MQCVWRDSRGKICIRRGYAAFFAIRNGVAQVRDQSNAEGDPRVPEAGAKGAATSPPGSEKLATSFIAIPTETATKRIIPDRAANRIRISLRLLRSIIASNSKMPSLSSGEMRLVRCAFRDHARISLIDRYALCRSPERFDPNSGANLRRLQRSPAFPMCYLVRPFPSPSDDRAGFRVELWRQKGRTRGSLETVSFPSDRPRRAGQSRPFRRYPQRFFSGRYRRRPASPAGPDRPARSRRGPRCRRAQCR